MNFVSLAVSFVLNVGFHIDHRDVCIVNATGSCYSAVYVMEDVTEEPMNQ